jgi:hypothetical protein
MLINAAPACHTGMRGFVFGGDILTPRQADVISSVQRRGVAP